MTKNSRKPDFQTLSLFITLAVLTGMFLFGLKWGFMTPESINPQPTEAAIGTTQSP